MELLKEIKDKLKAPSHLDERDATIYETAAIFGYSLASASQWVDVREARIKELENGLREIHDLYPKNERDGRPIIALNNIRELVAKLLPNE